MKRLLLALSLFLSSVCQAAPNPVVIINTSMGNIEIELFTKESPISVKNFLAYVNSDFYNGVIFHRVMPNFIVQAGGILPSGKEKPDLPPIKNEAANGLHNKRGTLAMARPPAVDGATSHFFINLNDNLFLDHSQKDYGYAVFGKVISGMDIVDKMATMPIKNELPITPILINKMTVKK
jgi:peptidyl-prolyl cis-trans isomerase A (cyclophilin A)